MTPQKIKTLTGMLVYVMLNRPVEAFDKSKPKEWKCGIVLTDEDFVDECQAEYPKQAPKKVKTADFEKIYKCKPPEDAGKNVWVITLKKSVSYKSKDKDGNDIEVDIPEKYKPKVFINEMQDGKLERIDITMTKLPANGSLGSISIDKVENSFGVQAKLRNVMVTELIEYEGATGEAGDEFDDPVPVKNAGVKKAEPKEASKPAKTKEKPAEDTSTEDDPF